MYTIPIFLATLLLTKSLIDCRLIPGTHNPSSNASLTDSILPDGIPSFPGEASQDFNHSPVGFFTFRRGTDDTESHPRTLNKSVFIFKHRTGDSDPFFDTAIKADLCFKHGTGDTDSPNSQLNILIKPDLSFKLRTGVTDSHSNIDYGYDSTFNQGTGVTDWHFKTFIISFFRNRTGDSDPIVIAAIKSDFCFKHRTGETDSSDSQFNILFKCDLFFKNRTGVTDPHLNPVHGDYYTVKHGTGVTDWLFKTFIISDIIFRNMTGITDPHFKTYIVITSRSRTHTGNCSPILTIRWTCTTPSSKTLTKYRLLTPCLLDPHPVIFPRIRLETFFNNANHDNELHTIHDNLFLLDCEDWSGSEQEAAPRTYSREEEEELLRSDSDDMDVDGESFHSARSESPKQQDTQTTSRVYKTVRAAKLASMTCRSLSTAGTRPLSPVGSFANPKDGRDSRAFNINSFIARRNISASFDLESLKCITCPLKPDHVVLYRELKEHCHYPVVFVICDQSFPASFPTGGEGECLKIIRVEDGSLAELTTVFLETIRPYSVPAGSVVMIHSLSHLAWVGAAAYTEDLVRSRQQITATYRSGISVIHGVPLLNNGSVNVTLVNDLKIVMSWYNAVRHPAERDIISARVSALNMISGASPAEGGQPMALPSASAVLHSQIASSVSGQPTAPDGIGSAGCGQPMALQPSVSLGSTSGQPMAPDGNGGAGCGQPMALQPPASLGSTSGQPMAPDGNVSTDCGQPMAPQPCTKGPRGSPMAPLSCPPMAQGTSAQPSTEPVTIRLRLPSSLDSMRTDIFEAEVGQLLVLPELDEGQERIVVEKLISELNTKFHVGLDANFSTGRDKDHGDMLPELIGAKYIVVGSSHACHIVEALQAQGETVSSLADPSWRLTDESAEKLANRLKKLVAENPESTVIFQLYDSCIYYSSTGPGERSLPRKGPDGKFHVPGDLVMADWPTFKQIFAPSIPLIRAAGKNRKTLLSPLPRYIMSRCCSDQDHLKNFGTREYVRAMGKALAETDDWIRDLAYCKRINNFSVVNTATLVDLDSPTSKKKELVQWWGSDPVHMTQAGYAKLVRNLTDRLEKAKEQEEEDKMAANKTKRRKVDGGGAYHGREGISRSDFSAKRHGGESGPARHKTGYKPRGSGGYEQKHKN